MSFSVVAVLLNVGSMLHSWYYTHAQTVILSLTLDPRKIEAAHHIHTRLADSKVIRWNYCTRVNIHDPGNEATCAA